MWVARERHKQMSCSSHGSLEEGQLDLGLHRWTEDSGNEY